MPWKTIGAMILLIFIILFIGFNLGETYTANISLIFYTFEKVPVFLIVLCSFTFGALLVMPVSVLAGKKKKHPKKNKESKNNSATSSEMPEMPKEEASSEPPFYVDDIGTRV